MDLSDYRKEYTGTALRRNDMDPDPLAEFTKWFSEAVAKNYHEPNAMTVATVDENGRPFQRTLLLKGISDGGFIFFTNYNSRKASHIARNPHVCLLFPWVSLERQIIIQGLASKVTEDESLEYFNTRPRDSQIGAWVSNQSAVIPSRDSLIEKLAELHSRFEGGPVPLPPFWGGYRVIPESIEFWQGGPGRLHDRVLYQHSPSGWRIDRLSP
jgi:pyridoxamine 5'-phosphate oxidase